MLAERKLPEVLLEGKWETEWLGCLINALSGKDLWNGEDPGDVT